MYDQSQSAQVQDPMTSRENVPVSNSSLHEVLRRGRLDGVWWTEDDGLAAAVATAGDKADVVSPLCTCVCSVGTIAAHEN